MTTKSDKATAAENLAKAEAAAEAQAATPEDAPAPTETIPGGLYRVGDKLVNAEGQEITKTGKVKGE